MDSLVDLGCVAVTTATSLFASFPAYFWHFAQMTVPNPSRSAQAANLRSTTLAMQLEGVLRATFHPRPTTKVHHAVLYLRGLCKSWGRSDSFVLGLAPSTSGSWQTLNLARRVNANQDARRAGARLRTPGQLWWGA
eukprot:3884555-Amphidinium_carterae.1